MRLSSRFVGGNKMVLVLLGADVFRLSEPTLGENNERIL